MPSCNHAALKATMPQTESHSEAIIDLEPPKPKRKPRKPAQASVGLTVEEISSQAEAIVAVAPSVQRRPRVRRTKAVTAAESVVVDAVVAPAESTEPIACAESIEHPLIVESSHAIDVIAPALKKAASVTLTGEAIPVRLAVASSVHPDVLALRRAVGDGRYALLPALSEDALLSVRLMPGAAVPPDPYCALVLTLPDGVIELGDGVRLLAALTGIDLGHSAVELPNTQWLHSAVIGRLGQTPLRDVIAITRGCLLPEQCEESSSNDGNNDSNNDVTTPTQWQAVRITLRSQQHAFSIQARGRAASWRDLLTRTHWQRERLPTNVFDDLPVCLPVLIGTHALPQMMLSEIDVGDILLPDSAAFDCTGNGRLRWRAMQLHVSFAAPAALTILTLEPSMEPHASADDVADVDMTIHVAPPAVSALADSALDGVPVQLRFEMGRCDTTLQSLRTMAPGTVLAINGGSPASIAVVANGRQLGTGELVEVNGQLGIRLIHWFA